MFEEVTEGVRNSYNSSTTKRCALELVKSVLTNYHQLSTRCFSDCLSHLRPVSQQLSSNHYYVHSIPSPYSYYNTIQLHPFPLLLKTLSERSAFPLVIRGTRVFFLPNQFSSELRTEARITLTCSSNSWQD